MINSIQISRRKMLILLTLFITTFTYNYLFHQKLVEDFLCIYFNQLEEDIGQVIFYTFYTASFFIGAILSDRIDRKKLLLSWVVSGIIANLLVLFFCNRNTVYLLMALTGLTLGYGQPSCFSYLVNLTSFENRGRVSSVIQFLIFIVVFLTFAFITVFGFSLSQIMLVGLVIRAATLIPLFLDSYEKEETALVSWGSIFKSRNTTLFFIPWILCSLSNGILIFFDENLPTSPEFANIISAGRYILMIGTSIFGLVSGFLADRSGRKQPLIIGFIILGISYAFVGVSTTPLNLIIMILLSGVGWGFITVILQWVVFGDLAPPGGEEKYYALALSTYPLFEAFFQFIKGVLNVAASPNVVALFVSVIMFISVFSLLMVPETLPDNLIKDRRFKEYLRKVLEVVEESSES